MSITQHFRKNVILFVLSLFAGLLIPFLSVKLNPSPRSQSLIVTYTYPNASPELIEQEISSRLESAFVTLRGLQNIRSTSDVGVGHISLRFDRTVKIEKLRLEIAMLIRQIYPHLNPGVSYPQIKYQSEFEKHNTLLIYSLSSLLPENELKEVINNRIIPTLSQLDNIYSIDISGLPTKEYQIILDDAKQKELGLELFDIRQSIQTYLRQRELGLVTVNLEGKKGLLAVRFGHQIGPKSAELMLLEIPLVRRGERRILLSDIATVKQAYNKPERYFRINSKNAVTLSISGDQNSNQIRTGKRLKAEIANLQKEFKDVIQFDIARDETKFIREELQKIGFRVGATFLLLFLFLAIIRPNISYLFLIWLGLLSALLISVIFYYVLGLEFHLYSIAGWTLSLGIVLDTFIIMVDHIRHHDNQKIFPAIFSASLTTIGALSVIFFIDEKYREILTDFSLIFIVNLLVALLVTLIFIPSLQHGLLRKRKNHIFSVQQSLFTRTFHRYILISFRFRGLYILLLVFSFGIPLFLLPREWEKDHIAARCYNQTLGSDLYQKKIRPQVEKYLGGTLNWFFQKKDQFFFEQKKQEKTRLFLYAKMPFGGTLEQLNEIILSIETYLRQYQEIDIYQSRINGPYDSSIEISFKSVYENGDFPYILKSRLESLAIETGSADFSVRGVGIAFNNEVRGARLSSQIQFLGYNYEELWRLANNARKSFLKHPRIIEAYINAESSYYEPTEEYFQIHLPQMANMRQNRLVPGQIGKLLHDLNLDKGTVGDLQIENQGYPVRLYTSDKQQNQLWNIQNRPHVIDTGRVYKNKYNLELSKETGQQKIVRVNQQYQLVLAYDFIGDLRLSQQIMEMKLDTMKQQIPMGYSIRKYQRFNEGYQETSQKLIFVLLAAIFAIVIISAILFNSLRQAIIPLLLIFPAFIGIFLCVSLFDFRFDQGGFASFLLVAGISVNGPLFIINDYNNYRKEEPKLSDIECFLKAFNAKITPVVLTALSTILGLLPFILFDSFETFWYSLAICTIGGVVFSTIAVYLLFPMFFLQRRSLQKN